MHVLDHLREWSASAEEWRELCDMQYRLHSQADLDRLAVLLDSTADRIERSRLVRAVSMQNVDLLRAQAAVARAGRDPFVEEPS